MTTMTSEAEFEVLTDDRLGAVVVVARGEIDVASAPELHAALNEAMGAQAGTVIVDLSAVTFIDSTGLGVLVGAEKDMREAEQHLQLVVSQPQISRLLELTGLDTVFTVVRNLDEVSSR